MQDFKLECLPLEASVCSLRVYKLESAVLFLNKKISRIVLNCGNYHPYCITVQEGTKFLGQSNNFVGL